MFCGSCGSAAPVDATYCGQCGAALSATAGAAAATPEAYGLPRYEPPPQAPHVQEYVAPPQAPPVQEYVAPPQAPLAQTYAPPPYQQPPAAYAQYERPAPPVPSAGQQAAAAAATAATRVRSFAASLPLGTLVPLRAWTNPTVWRTPTVLVFFAAVGIPFVLLQVGSNASNFTSVAWGFALYFACAWAGLAYWLIRPGVPRWQLVTGVALFTAVAGTAMAKFVEEHVIKSSPTLLTYIFAVGLPEELAKALPIFLFMYLSRRAHTLRMYVFVGVVSGLAFGAAEAVAYSKLYAQLAALTAGDGGAPLALVAQVWRLVSGSMFHGALAGITAFFIGLASYYRRASVPLIAFGLGFTAVLHGCYDDFANHWLGTAVALFILACFAGYVRTGDDIVEQFARLLPEDAEPPATPPSVAG